MVMALLCTQAQLQITCQPPSGSLCMVRLVSSSSRVGPGQVIVPQVASKPHLDLGLHAAGDHSHSRLCTCSTDSTRLTSGLYAM